ncbi:zinc ribbon domain-containing protein [Clostridium sp. D2Q-11]|uniref:Zinc ribbon domain-containing protein n=1 Tax=Anaeromonas frigoriresistens TaxID=2683708 RepID=A0A942UWY8_9FIRM|nr:zinc ribbon domain-containing protein [Anaeromonas frigoriresistens]MBS4538436.1 zinc ribbon domain-containing protein [Anaeromonas frigoriresistens]
MFMFETIIFSILSLLLLIYFLGVGIFVYRDAPKHGMKRGPWVLIATLIPNFLGLVVYLLVRNNTQRENCINCGKSIEKDYQICPYYKHNRRLKCDNCGQEINEEWIVCPSCSSSLDNKGEKVNEK